MAFRAFENSLEGNEKTDALARQVGMTCFYGPESLVGHVLSTATREVDQFFTRNT